MTWNKPVVIIGMDAATWDVMDPLLAAGKLPNIARLMREGTSGPLKSLVQYPSPALWTSILTGKRPEKHGVIDFYSATRHHVRSATLSDILEGDRGRAGYFRWFATWPPKENAGFTVPSAIARTAETYPQALQFLNELIKAEGLGSYARGALNLLKHGGRISTLARGVAEAGLEVLTKPGVLDWWYRRRLVEAAIYGDVFVHLLRRYQPGFAAILLFHTDDLSHRYWKYRQPERFSDVNEEDVRRYRGVIDEGYIASDRVVGQILDAIPEDSLVVVASDHGQQAGSEALAPFRLSPNLLKLLGFQDTVWMTHIGYSASLRPRPDREDRPMLQALYGALEQVQTFPAGEPVFDVTEEDGLQIVARARLDADAPPSQLVSVPGCQPVPLGEVVFTDGRISGIHSEWGILILKGPGVKRGHRVEGATILDVTPTLLALRGMPVGRDMDGRVLVDASEDSFLRESPVQYTESYETEAPGGEDLPFSGDELEDLEGRLRSLGYLG